ncbi:MAG: 30S ribosomal protein S9 [Candidatus Methanocomedens sp.]|nr:MAG: 30S ribosomal protein S9 [ANME-2 cluster archaeon]
MVKIINTSGKKKTAIARATIKDGIGRVRINKKPLEIFKPDLVRLKMMEPLSLAGDKITSKVDIDINVKGGGIMGQADAVRTAIGKGLVEWSGDLALKDIMLGYDRNLLVNDSRQKETKKFGGPGARAKTQKSYR